MIFHARGPDIFPELCVRILLLAFIRAYVRVNCMNLLAFCRFGSLCKPYCWAAFLAANFHYLAPAGAVSCVQEQKSAFIVRKPPLCLACNLPGFCNLSLGLFVNKAAHAFLFQKQLKKLLQSWEKRSFSEIPRSFGFREFQKAALFEKIANLTTTTQWQTIH